jgi:hypothetical protein
VRAYDRDEKVTFGTNMQGWSRTRAEVETERIIQQIERGTWVPPRLEPREDRLQESMAALGVQVDAYLQAFWRQRGLSWRSFTVIDCRDLSWLWSPKLVRGPAARSLRKRASLVRQDLPRE